MLTSARRNTGQPWDGFLVARERTRPAADVHGVAGKRILITGAGGYIGSALACALSTLPIAQLLLLDIAEHGLYSLDHELETAGTPSSRSLMVGSICDDALVQEIFDEYRPEIVFHAAAHKHVPLMEANPFAAAETNALGTLKMVQAAVQFEAEQFVLLSTDKAVDPISIMGATKRLAELIVLTESANTAMKILRLCNVLGSTGSVAPLFCRQIEQGGPVTVTDKEATRYFLSVDETVQCLISAASPAFKAGLYIPPLGPPYRIEDLASFLIETASLSHSRCNIVHLGLRPGDKLNEKMISSHELMLEGDEVLTRVERTPTDAIKLRKSVDAIGESVQHRDLAKLLRAIEEVVPEYSASELLRCGGKVGQRLP
jgi:FlaA1/EpsC-like NDP-sugar epimerase